MVALAYDRAVGCAGTALKGDVVPDAEVEAALFEFCAALLRGLGADETVLVIRTLVEGTRGIR